MNPFDLILIAVIAVLAVWPVYILIVWWKERSHD